MFIFYNYQTITLISHSKTFRILSSFALKLDFSRFLSRFIYSACYSCTPSQISYNYILISRKVFHERRTIYDFTMLCEYVYTSNFTSTQKAPFRISLRAWCWRASTRYTLARNVSIKGNTLRASGVLPIQFYSNYFQIKV